METPYLATLDGRRVRVLYVDPERSPACAWAKVTILVPLTFAPICLSSIYVHPDRILPLDLDNT